MKKLKPAHPGAILLQEFIVPLGLTQYRVSKEAGIAHSTMTQIVNGLRPISVENAIRLGLYFGTTAEFWVNLQTDYDLRQARRKKLKTLAKQIKPLDRAA